MAVTEHIGYGKRIKNAFAGVIVGMLMFLGSFFVHGFNERNAIRETKAINEIEEVAIPDVPTDTVNEANDGKLVHMKGSAKTAEMVTNQRFGIEENAIRLSWDASIYQLVEKKTKRDDKVTYSYTEEWRDKVVDSSGFQETSKKNANDGSRKTLPADGSDQASKVDYGAFKLNNYLIGEISGATAYSLETVPDSFEDKGTIQDGVYFTGEPSAPQIGDEKISFSIVRTPQDVTVMAQQQNNSFTAYKTKIGKTKELLYMGLLSKEMVIDKQREAAFMIRWLLRGGGFLLMWFGLMLVTKPLAALASILPFGGRIMSSITGVVSFLIAACLSLVAIAVFWFAFRPVLSAVLLVGAVGCVFAAIMFRRKRAAANAGSDVVDASATRPPPPPMAAS